MFLRWLIFSNILMEEASDTSSGGGGGETLVDTSSTAEAGLENLTGELDESTEGTGEPDGLGPDGQPKVPEKESKVDWRTVPQEVKNHIAKLRADGDSKTANLIQNAVYTSQSMLKEFPGGLKEAQALKNSIEELGGIEEIKTLQSTHRQFVEQQEALDSRAKQGDPAAIDSFINIAGKDGFAKLMPVAMDKWSASDREGYQHVMSQVMVNAMREGGVVAELNMAFKLLGLKTEAATTEAMSSLERVATWANGINKIAVTVPAKPQIDPNIQNQQKELDSQRDKMFNTEFSNQFGTWRNSQIDEQLKTIANGRVLNEYQRKTLGQRVVQDIQDILTVDSEYMKSLNKIYGTRDMAELQKFTRARTAKLLPEVTRKAFKSLFSDPTRKPITKTGTKPGAITQPVVPVVKGWTKVAPDKAPTPDQIDNKKTDFNMKFKRQAILKNGTKVYWGTHVPQ